MVGKKIKLYFQKIDYTYLGMRLKQYSSERLRISSLFSMKSVLENVQTNRWSFGCQNKEIANANCE